MWCKKEQARTRKKSQKTDNLSWYSDLRTCSQFFRASSTPFCVRSNSTEVNIQPFSICLLFTMEYACKWDTAALVPYKGIELQSFCQQHPFLHRYGFVVQVCIHWLSTEQFILLLHGTFLPYFINQLGIFQFKSIEMLSTGLAIDLTLEST